jgi:hypothetical protein
VGEHGYDATRVPEMKAIFFAAGPDIRHGVALEPFENVNLDPLIAGILGLDITNLKPGPVDGKLGVLERSLTAMRVIFLAARKMRSRQLFPLSSISTEPEYRIPQKHPEIHSYSPKMHL